MPLRGLVERPRREGPAGARGARRRRDRRRPPAAAGYSDEVQGVRVPRNRVVKATGWVPAAGIKALIAAKELKQAPARESATVAALSGFRSESGGRRVGFGPDGIAVKRLIACRGSWVEVETELGTGWVEKVCAR